MTSTTLTMLYHEFDTPYFNNINEENHYYAEDDAEQHDAEQHDDDDDNDDDIDDDIDEQIVRYFEYEVDDDYSTDNGDGDVEELDDDNDF
jgi:hypothetical protein